MEYCLKQITPEGTEPLKIILKENDIIIGHQNFRQLYKYDLVSRRHALVKKIKQYWFISDLTSTHGLFVNGYKVGNAMRQLEIGDVIGFGLVFDIECGFICTFCSVSKENQDSRQLLDGEIKIETMTELQSSSSLVKTEDGQSFDNDFIISQSQKATVQNEDNISNIAGSNNQVSIINSLQTVAPMDNFENPYKSVPVLKKENGLVNNVKGNVDNSSKRMCVERSIEGISNVQNVTPLTEISCNANETCELLYCNKSNSLNLHVKSETENTVFTELNMTVGEQEPLDWQDDVEIINMERKGYPQVEEVIYISDEENYLSLNSSRTLNQSVKEEKYADVLDYLSEESGADFLPLESHFDDFTENEVLPEKSKRKKNSDSGSQFSKISQSEISSKKFQTAAVDSSSEYSDDSSYRCLNFQSVNETFTPNSDYTNLFCHLEKKFELANILRNLENLHLCKYILNLDKNVVKCDFAHSRRLDLSFDFTSDQRNVINAISSELKKPLADPKIMLLHGLPGTGKTQTIIGILENEILNTGKSKFLNRKKILVLTSSNVAFNEIGDRFICLAEMLHWKNGSNAIENLLAIGSEQDMHEKIQNFTLDKLEERISLEMQTFSEKRAVDLQEVRAKIKKINAELKSSNDKAKIQQIATLIKKERKLLRLQRMKRYNPTKYKRQKQVLQRSHVIISTIESLSQTFYVNLFQHAKISFSCCIVDEATQCTELSLIQPLIAFGINRLVLVGDHMQLPPNNLQSAVDHIYEHSLFEKIYLHFTRIKTENPMCLLTEQFRMHPEISSFPSRYFYDSKITNHFDICRKYKSFPFLHYMVYDFSNTEDQECKFLEKIHRDIYAVLNICSQILQSTQVSIGVITAYKDQVELFEKELHQMPINQNIEIGIVDGFQAKEKDVIIIYCVQNNSSSSSGILSCRKRFNVAITRARLCLIICTDKSTIKNCTFWQDLVNDAYSRDLCLAVPNVGQMSNIFNNTMRKK